MHMSWWQVKTCHMAKDVRAPQGMPGRPTEEAEELGLSGTWQIFLGTADPLIKNPGIKK